MAARVDLGVVAMGQGMLPADKMIVITREVRRNRCADAGYRASKADPRTRRRRSVAHITQANLGAIAAKLKHTAPEEARLPGYGGTPCTIAGNRSERLSDATSNLNLGVPQRS